MSIYLFLYNFIQFCGWCFFFSKVVYYSINSLPLQEIYLNTHIILECCQYGAFLEIVHSILGIVKSNIFATFIQIIGRIAIVLILQFYPSSISNGYFLLSFGWSIIEIVRYSYYILSLFQKDFSNFNIPYLLIWCRYSFFVVLYPIGVSGEIITIWNAKKDFSKYTLWKNSNFKITLADLVYPAYFLYIPSLIFLYGYLFKKRKKVLNRLNNVVNVKMKKNE